MITVRTNVDINARYLDEGARIASHAFVRKEAAVYCPANTTLNTRHALSASFCFR